ASSTVMSYPHVSGMKKPSWPRRSPSVARPMIASRRVSSGMTDRPIRGRMRPPPDRAWALLRARVYAAGGKKGGATGRVQNAPRRQRTVMSDRAYRVVVARLSAVLLHAHQHRLRHHDAMLVPIALARARDLVDGVAHDEALDGVRGHSLAGARPGQLRGHVVPGAYTEPRRLDHFPHRVGPAEEIRRGVRRPHHRKDRRLDGTGHGLLDGEQAARPEHAGKAAVQAFLVGDVHAAVLRPDDVEHATDRVHGQGVAD